VHDAGEKRKAEEAELDDEDPAEARKRRALEAKKALDLSSFRNKPKEEIMDGELDRFWQWPEPTPLEMISPLDWWKRNRTQFPVLARLARKYLAVPASAAPVERLWSDAGIITEKRRARLKAHRVSDVLIIHHNLDLAELIVRRLFSKGDRDGDVQMTPASASSSTKH